jgi:hypothetical protein
MKLNNLATKTGLRHGQGNRPANHRDIEGGAAAGALPHFSFGVDPISKTNLPPLAMSEWLNQGWSRGLPFKVAD